MSTPRKKKSPPLIKKAKPRPKKKPVEKECWAPLKATEDGLFWYDTYKNQIMVFGYYEVSPDGLFGQVVQATEVQENERVVPVCGTFVKKGDTLLLVPFTLRAK